MSDINDLRVTLGDIKTELTEDGGFVNIATSYFSKLDPIKKDVKLKFKRSDYGFGFGKGRKL